MHRFGPIRARASLTNDGTHRIMSKETLHEGTKVTPSAPELAVKSSHIPRRPKITPPKPRKDISTPTIDLGEIPNLQILNEKGEISDPSHEPKLEPAELLRI